MTFRRLKYGKEGEKAATAYLRKKGYRILDTNFRTAAGEIDIVAEHEKMVVFVEVKARADEEFGHPFTAVSPAKQKKIARLARSFLARHRITERDCRFDVVAITGADPDSWTIELLQDAFRV